MKQIIVEKNIPVNNNELADKNRKLLDEKQIFTINLQDVHRICSYRRHVYLKN